MKQRVILCGAKGAGKSELLKALSEYQASLLNSGQDAPQLVPNHLDDGKWGEWSLDKLADYRTELYVALDRADEDALPNAVYESSLIDNVSYAATRLAYIINDGIGTDDDLSRWEIVLQASA